MTWVKVDDGAPLHPKLLDAGPEAAWLWLCGLAYCNRVHTEGKIPARHLTALYPHGRWTRAKLLVLAAKLVEVGLWITSDDGYNVHDYEEFQGDANRAAVLNAARQKAWRGRHRNGAETGDSNVTSNVTSDAESNVTVERNGNVSRARPRARVTRVPVPSRPDQQNTPLPPACGGPDGGGRDSVTADSVLAALRSKAGRAIDLSAAIDLRVVQQLQTLVTDLAVSDAPPTLAAYHSLADWIGAGGLGWMTGKRPGIAYLLKPGTTARHLGESAAWEAGGRQRIDTASPKGANGRDHGATLPNAYSEGHPTLKIATTESLKAERDELRKRAWTEAK